jgi:acetyl esterase/lipase
MRHRIAQAAAISIALGFGGPAIADDTAQTPAAQIPARPVFGSDGTVHVPAFDLPASTLSSKQAQDFQRKRAAFKMPAPMGGTMDINTMRRGMEMYLGAQVKGMRDRYPVDIVEQTIGGVRTRVITPQGVKVDPKRILINLHGGGFQMCADACAMLESLPIASLGGYKVITVDYREAPEAVFPAASEDVAAVYREVLKTHKPKNVGIYGCSAGGALTAEAAAWFTTHGLPEPGAIGIFGAGGVRFATGDSAYVSAYIDGSFPPPAPPGSPPPQIRSYFAGTDMNDPMVSPAGDLGVLAKFPPTLLITGTRAMDMSPAVYTHSQLIKAGVPGDLIVGEGMSHCYIYQSDLPEAQDGYQAIVNFFHKNLK